MSDTRVMLYKEFGLEMKDQTDASQESLFKPEWLERMDRATWSPPMGSAIRMQCPKCFTLFWAHEALWGMKSNDLIVNCPGCSKDLIVTKCVHDIREDEDDLKKPDEVIECMRELRLFSLLE